jgi:hypothetical protein
VDGISRRDFLRGLIGRGAHAFAESVAGDLGEDEPPPAPPPAPVTVAREGEVLEGIPVAHPWIAVARAVAEKHGRRIPYILLLGASGEAFRLAWSLARSEEAARHGPLNSFLGALAIPGLSARAATGGPLEPALGGAETALANGRTVVLGTARGPALLVEVDRKVERVRWITPATGPVSVPFPELARLWSSGRWPSGPAPFLRVVVEPIGAPRPLDEVARAGFETMLLLLTKDFGGETATGLAAYEAWAEDLREDRIGAAEAEILHGELLQATGVGRAAAARFLEAVSRALPPDVREPVEAAARCYARVHSLSATGEFWGTGLFPELVECLTTDEIPDPGLLADEAVRERAAELVDGIREQEARAVEHILSLPEDQRTAGG